MLILNSLDDQQLIDAIQAGGVGVIPTDTIYGLVCRADQPVPVKRLYKLKSRDRKPGTVIAANADQLVTLGIPARYLKAVEQYWPNPISIIVPTKPELAYLDFGMSLATRVPSDESLHRLLEKTGPLLTTSANLPGEQPAADIKEAQAYFNGKVDFYVNGGNLSDRPPSTIIRVVDDEVQVVRGGAVKLNNLGEIIHDD